MKCCADKHRGLEHKIVELIRNSQENTSISDKLHRWTRAIMQTANPGDLPDVLVKELKHQFQIPQPRFACGVLPTVFGVLSFARPVSVDAQSFAASLTQPYAA